MSQTHAQTHSHAQETAAGTKNNSLNPWKGLGMQLKSFQSHFLEWDLLCCALPRLGEAGFGNIPPGRVVVAGRHCLGEPLSHSGGQGKGPRSAGNSQLWEGSSCCGKSNSHFRGSCTCRFFASRGSWLGLLPQGWAAAGMGSLG